MSTLVLAEHDHGSIKESTHKAVTAAISLGQDIDVLVAGHNCQAAAESASKIACVRKVRIADDVSYQHFLAENMATLIVSLATEYEAIVAPATTHGKNILPRVAALLDVMQISDVTRILSPTRFERPIYAGNAMITVESRDAKKVMTVRTTAFTSASTTGNTAIEPVASKEATHKTAFVKQELSQSARPELTAAKIVVSGGRALGSEENFKLIEKLADRLGAAVGASRAAVDAGYAPNDYQVGQTGKVVAPELYMAIGISGAIQHLAGMKDSKVIVAINKDPEAPIFQVADIGMVGDLFQVIPEIESELTKIGR